MIFSKSSLFILAIALMGLTFTGCQPEKKQPNIIMFLVDDMGWQDTSVPFYKDITPFNKRYQTPAMERLASEGLKFSQAYSCSVCSPTRVSLMTGMNAARHRVTNWTLRKNMSVDAKDTILTYPDWNVNGMSPVDGIVHTVYATPLPKLLKDAGYFTIHCGKAHLGAISTPGENPLNLGFDINIAGHAAGAPGSYQGTDNFGNSNDEINNIWAVPGLEEYWGKDINLTEALTIEAIKAMDSAQAKKEPFFLYMAHYAVHTPLEPDNRFIKKYRSMSLEEPEARYASMIESMDKSLGDLMNYLEKNEIADNTVILFMSDNGGLSAVARGGIPHTHNKPLSSGKGSAHEGGIREPMIVKWPGVTKSGTTNNEYLIIEDFFPTILEMAGIKDANIVQPVDGISFVPKLKGHSEDNQDRVLIWHFPNNWGPTGPGIGATSTVRKGNWKLIYYHKNGYMELFNIRDDIGENENLAEKEPEKLTEMANLLSEKLKEYDAQMPVYQQTGEEVKFPDEVLP